MGFLPPIPRYRTISAANAQTYGIVTLKASCLRTLPFTAFDHIMCLV